MPTKPPCGRKRSLRGISRDAEIKADRENVVYLQPIIITGWHSRFTLTEMTPDCSPELYTENTISHLVVQGLVPWIVIGGILWGVCTVIGVIVVLALALCSGRWKEQLYLYSTISSAKIIASLAQIPGVSVAVKKKDEIEIDNNNQQKWENFNYSSVVCFEVQKRHFRVSRWMTPVTFGLGALLAYAYIGVYITLQWQQTQDCTPLVPSVEKSCFNLPCPNTVNCTAWRKAGKVGQLLCWSQSLDVFGVLIRFLGLVGFQVAIMRLTGLVVHGGCPCRNGDTNGKRIWTEYFGFLMVHLLFGMALLVVIVAMSVVAVNSDNTTDILTKLIIPMSYLLIVAIAEWFNLLAFVCMLCVGALVREKDVCSIHEEDKFIPIVVNRRSEGIDGSSNSGEKSD